MKIDKLHQPYIFKNNDNINIIVSELQEQKFEITFANTNLLEDYWKLKILDESYNLYNLVTPQTIEINSKTYFVVAECNGYINGDKISYIVGVHSKEINTPLRLFLVEGNLDLENKIVSNLEIKETTRSGFIKENEIFKISNKDRVIYKSNVKLFDFTDILDSTVRLIGVYNQNKIIITGIKNNQFNSYLFDYDNGALKKIKNNEGSDIIYKCSIIGNEDDGILSYTDKVYVNENEKEHILNINVGYIIENN